MDAGLDQRLLKSELQRQIDSKLGFTIDLIGTRHFAMQLKVLAEPHPHLTFRKYQADSVAFVTAREVNGQSLLIPSCGYSRRERPCGCRSIYRCSDEGSYRLTQ